MCLFFQISESIPLVGDLEELSSLEKEYNEDPVYLLKVKDLSAKYKNIRRTRPDGNCFFRAFSFAYLEQLLTDKAEYDKFYEIAKNSKEVLVALGFPQFTVEDFYETVSSRFFKVIFVFFLLLLRQDAVGPFFCEFHSSWNSPFICNRAKL